MSAAAGAEELETWLLDLMRQGLADLPARPRSFWETAAARLVDNQLPGLAAVLRELAKIRSAGELVRQRGMRFNAGHALNYFNVQPVAALPGIRELHIGHAIVSRALFVGFREAVAEMKRLIREAAARNR